MIDSKKKCAYILYINTYNLISKMNIFINLLIKTKSCLIFKSHIQSILWVIQNIWRLATWPTRRFEDCLIIFHCKFQTSIYIERESKRYHPGTHI